MATPDSRLVRRSEEREAGDPHGARRSALVLAVALLVFAGGCRATRPAPSAAGLPHALGRIADGIRRAGRIPGLSLAVVRNGGLVFATGSGLADREASVPARAETLYGIGSISKLLTAGVLVRLVSRGVVKLDDPVRRWVPEFPDGRVTLAMLATHTAGIRHYRGGEAFNREHYESLSEVLPRFIHDPLVATPGREYHYSSYGFVLLGVALERAAGKAFPQLVRRLVTGPLGLSRIHPTGTPPEAAVAKGYVLWRGEIAASPPHDYSDRWPAGGYLADAPSLAAFASAAVGGFFTASERRLLFTPRIPVGRGGEAVGLAWRIGHDGAGREFVHHEGSELDSRAVVLAFPAERLAVAIEANLALAPLSDADARFVLDVVRCGGGSPPGDEFAGRYAYRIARDEGEPSSGAVFIDADGGGWLSASGGARRSILWCGRCGHRLMLLGDSGGRGAELFWLTRADGELRGHTSLGRHDLTLERSP
jgi:serine beta-lactamase-like protein LACTB, mitochondrial